MIAFVIGFILGLIFGACVGFIIYGLIDSNNK